MHFNTAQSRSAWTEQEDELLRHAVTKFGDRAWATVANDVPGRSSKSCSDRWRNFLSPDIEHPRKSPFTEWEVAVVVQAQTRYGNNWKAISMLLPGRTNRAVKNLFVGNLKWGARLPEIRNRYLEMSMSLEELLEIKPEHAGGPVRPRPGASIPTGSGSPSSMRAASTSSAGSAWASDITDQPLSGSPASAGTHHHADRRRRGEHPEHLAGQSPPLCKRRRAVPSPVAIPHHHQLQHGSASYSPTVVPHPGALGPSSGLGSPSLMGLGDIGPSTGVSSAPAALVDPLMLPNNAGVLVPLAVAVKQRISGNGSEPNGMMMPGLQMQMPLDEGSPRLASAGVLGNAGYMTAGRVQLQAMNSGLGLGLGRSNSLPGLPALMMGQMPGPQQQQQQQLGAHGMMVGRISSWHPGCMSSPVDLSTAAAMGGSCSSSPFAPYSGASAVGSLVAVGGMQPQTQRVLMPGTGLPSLNMTGIKQDPMAIDAGDCTGSSASLPSPYPMQQQHAAAWPMELTLQQQQQQHYGQLQQAQQPPLQQQAQSSMDHMQHQQQQQQQLGMRRSAGGIPAMLGPHVAASLAGAAGLAIPGSPTALPQNILQDMKSNDSAALQQMLDGIFDEGDDVLSEPSLAKLVPDASQLHPAGVAVVDQQAVTMAPSTQHVSYQHLPSPLGQQQQQQQHHAHQQVTSEAEAAVGGPTMHYSANPWNRQWQEVSQDRQAVAQHPLTGAGIGPGVDSTAAASLAQQQQQLMLQHQSQMPQHHPGLPHVQLRSGSTTSLGPGPAQATPWTGGYPGTMQAGMPALPGSGPPSTGTDVYSNIMVVQLQQENMYLMHQLNTLRRKEHDTQYQQAIPPHHHQQQQQSHPLHPQQAVLDMMPPAQQQQKPEPGMDPHAAIAGGQQQLQQPQLQPAAIEKHELVSGPCPVPETANALEPMPPVAAKHERVADVSGGGWGSGGGLIGCGSGSGALVGLAKDGSLTPADLLESCGIVEDLIPADI